MRWMTYIKVNPNVVVFLFLWNHLLPDKHHRYLQDGLIIMENVIVNNRCFFRQVEREAHGCHGTGCRGSNVADDFETSSSPSSSSSSTRNPCIEVRRYAVVTLTNLTFGNSSIKSFLCSFPGFIPIMVGQLESPFETLRKATAHLFRNLAWKTEKNSKQVGLLKQMIVPCIGFNKYRLWMMSHPLLNDYSVILQLITTLLHFSYT